MAPLYAATKVAIDADQLEKLKKDILNENNGKVAVKIQIKKTVGGPSPSWHTLLLTRSQIKGIENARKKGRRRFKLIRMSQLQLKKNRSHPGGFLGFLASLAARALPALAKGIATGALGGAAEQFMKGGGDGLYLFKRGHCLKVDPVKGNGLYLRSAPSGNGLGGGEGAGRGGDGLYLKRGNSLQAVGDGLILGENSPFKKIPILGWIL